MRLRVADCRGERLGKAFLAGGLLVTFEHELRAFHLGLDGRFPGCVVGTAD